MNRDNTTAYLQKLGIRTRGRWKTSGWIDAFCPFAPYLHETKRDNTPSFGVHFSDEGYSAGYCFACKQRGTLAELAFRLAKFTKNKLFTSIGHEINDTEFKGAGAIIPEWEDLEKPTEKQEEKQQTFANRTAELFRYPSFLFEPIVYRYLKSRGVSVSTGLKLGLRYTALDSRGEYCPRMLFPVRDIDGVFRGFTGRALLNSIQPKVRDFSGLKKRTVFLGERDVLLQKKSGTANYVIIVEGPLDRARLIELGFRNSMAILGSDITDEKIAKIAKLDLPVYWFVDNDNGGKHCLLGPKDSDGKYEYTLGAVWKLRDTVPQFYLPYLKNINDPGSYDPNDVSKTLTVNDMRKMLRNARPINPGLTKNLQHGRL